MADAGYIFGAPGLPKTPQELAQMRAVAQALAMRGPSAPKNVGEGLSAIGNALAYRGMIDDMTKAQTAGNASAAAAMGGLLSGMGGAGASSAAPVTPPAPSTPSIPPQALSPGDLSTTPAPMSGGNVSTPQTADAGINVPEQYKPIIAQASQQYGIPPDLLARQLHAESGFNPNATSPVGAQGIAQFMPGTAKDMGVNALDPNSAIPGAAQYMAQNKARYGGDMVKALAAYNWGPGNVDKWNGDPSTLPAETRNYVTKILGPGAFSGAQGASGAPAAPNAMVGAGDSLASLLGPASAYADTPKPGDTLLQQPQAPQSGPALALNGTNPQPGNPLAGGPVPSPAPPLAGPDAASAPPAGMQPFTSPQNLQTLATKPVTLPIAGQTPQAAPQAAPTVAPQSSGPTVQALMKAAQNPWLMAQPGSAAIVKALLAQKLQQQDPAKAVELQLNKAKLDNLTNPDMKFVPNASHDQYGNAIGGFVDTKNGTVKLIGTNGQPVPPGGATPAPNADVHGEEFLKTIEPGKAETVKGIAEGRIPYPSGFIMKTPYGQWLTQAVGQYEPGIDATTINQRHKMRTDLGASSPNSMGGIISNGKSAFDHLAELSDRYAQLGNYNGPDVPGGGVMASAGNYVGNELLPTANTKDKLQQAADNALKYGQEATKFYAGTGGGEAERMNALHSVNPGTATSAQMAGYLETERSLMLDRLRQKEAQITDTLGPSYLQQHPVMTPDLQQQITKINANIAKLRGQSGSVPAAAPSLPQGWTVQVH